ncbi:hypothetical protein F4805DRAFT_351812 [Annulohypoxylon moriforme]|nr:hypothetical protein F4805DRAFT_351812 [Annulohypoxylon moriforme]
MASSQPDSLQLAERINNVTGKDQLVRICVGGLVLESFWHQVVERNFLKTPIPVVRKYLVRAALFWPGMFLVTKTALVWADWRVRKATKERRESGNTS